MAYAVALEADGLGKDYSLARPNSGLLSVVRGMFAAEARTLVALNDVSFKISNGEAIGIIGRNGSGKSTLLKILSRVTAPTRGSARINGRLASLLELGTGFHGDLTGRENVFLNGALLGMSKEQIRKRFDEIVDFSGVQKFVDTPVKRYSSGMYVRLAFSVAALLDPEIMVVDEVLSVGDIGFQSKSFAKMKEAVQKEGRTVVIVSHDLEAIRSFCGRVLVLDRGNLAFDGETSEAIGRYLSSQNRTLPLSGVNLRDRLNRCSGHVLFTSVSCRDENGHLAWSTKRGGGLTLRFEFQAIRAVENLVFTLRLSSGPVVLTCLRSMVSATPLAAGARGRIDVCLPDLSLRPGFYSLYALLIRADYSQPYDVLDQNVDLPSVQIVEQDKGLLAADLIDMQHAISVHPATGARTETALHKEVGI